MNDNDVLYEDNHLIIVNKQTSQIVQGDKSGDIPLCSLVKEYIRVKYHKPGEAFLGVVHRLDRPVSGIVVFAKTSKALTRMNALFRDKGVDKRYWAIVKNMPPSTEGTLVHYLKKNEPKNKSFAYDTPKEGCKRAELHYRLLTSSHQYHLLEIELKTGRHHQIRCQLAKIGCPIKGDLKYGFPRSNPDGGISLQSHSIRFVHPVSKQEIFVVAPLPNDNLWQTLMP